VQSDVMELTMPVDSRSSGQITIAAALAIREWSMTRIYELLVETGLHTPATVPTDPVLPQPVTPAVAIRNVPPVVFSSPGAEPTRACDVKTAEPIGAWTTPRQAAKDDLIRVARPAPKAAGSTRRPG
jgi:hypothetical protein